MTIADEGWYIQEPFAKEMFEVENEDKYCEFHKFKGHSTNYCVQLKDILEKLARQGELHQYINQQFYKDHAKLYKGRGPRKTFARKTGKKPAENAPLLR